MNKGRAEGSSWDILWAAAEVHREHAIIGNLSLKLRELVMVKNEDMSPAVQQTEGRAIDHAMEQDDGTKGFFLTRLFV